MAANTQSELPWSFFYLFLGALALKKLSHVQTWGRPSSGLLDIEEAHLRFDRGSSAQRTIETGMPTLRRFIRPTDWDRIEGAGTAGTGSCGRPYRHDALHQAVKDNKLKT